MASKRAKYKNKSSRKSKEKRKNKYKQEKLNPKFIFFSALIIIVLTFISYYSALNNEFVNLDDDKYIIGNKLITEFSADRIKGFFSQFFDGNYHPLTLTSLAFDYNFAKLDPEFYHIHNIILHILNSLLVYIFAVQLFRKVFNKRSAELALVTALLFGVHTIHVESVTWATERKDVLYTLHFLLSLIFYNQYIIKKKTKFLFLSLGFFIISLLSKGMAVSLAISVIALDVLYKRKIFDKKVIIEKIPYLIIAVIFGIIAIFAQKSKGYINTNQTYTFIDRIIFACYGFTNYIIKLIAPVKLSAIYSYPESEYAPALYYLYLIPIFAVIYIFIRTLKTNKFIAFTILFFTANIFFVLQLLPVGGVIMSDRYSYVPSIAFYLLIAYGFYYFSEKKANIKKILISILAIYTVGLMYLTYNRNKVWENSITLWDNVLTQYPRSISAWYNRGIANFDIAKEIGGKNGYDNEYLKRAINDYDEAIAVKPSYTDALYNSGNAAFYAGNVEDAIERYSRAIKYNPNYLNAYYNRGIANIRAKNFEAAKNDCTKAISLSPNYLEAYYNRGIANINLGDNKSAISDFNTVLKINPNYANAYLYRGITKTRTNQKDEACQDLKRATQLGAPGADQKYKSYCK